MPPSIHGHGCATASEWHRAARLFRPARPPHDPRRAAAGGAPATAAAPTAVPSTERGISMLKLVRAALLAGAALMAAGGAHAETVIRAVMHSPLRLTDPHATTAYITTRSEEHTSELQSLMRISYAVFFLKKNKQNTQ